MSSNLFHPIKQFQNSTSSNEKEFLVRSSFIFVNYVFINIAGWGLVRLPYLRTSGRTEEFTFKTVCQFEKQG